MLSAVQISGRSQFLGQKWPKTADCKVQQVSSQEVDLSLGVFFLQTLLQI
jgi:hypothetical protein